MPDRLRRIRHVVLDMDGTIYLGGALFPATLPFLEALSELGIAYTFLTNNNSRARSDYAELLSGMGITADPRQIYTSAHATIHYLQTRLPGVRRLFVVGTPSLMDEFEAAGFQCVDEGAEALVVGFDTGLTYDRLSRAAYLASQSLPYVATHPDLVCPTDKPTVLPDCGSLCAMLKAATGRDPDAIPGKPSGEMLNGVRQSGGLSDNEIAVVGDRLYTDIRMARDAGALAVLTLTGEACEDDLRQAPPSSQPDLVVAGLDELAALLRSAHAEAKASRSA